MYPTPTSATAILGPRPVLDLALQRAERGWCREAPASQLLGPWKPPVDLAEALAQIEAVLALKRGRDAVLARSWAIADHLGLWQQAGFDCRWAFAREVFGWSRRTAQRRRRVGWALEWYPELDAAVRNGLGLGAAALVSTVMGRESAGRWLAVAERTGRRELARAVEAARESAHPRRVLARYEQAIDLADRWVSEAPALRAPTAGGPLKVALSMQESAVDGGREMAIGGSAVKATGGSVHVAVPRGDPRQGSEVLEAAQWWVGHIVLPKVRGFAAVKARDGHQCQNPECGRLTLRVEAHHIHHREHGGADTLDNGLTVCRPCHLRGLHAGGTLPRIRVAMTRVAGRSARVWRYADGRQVLQLRPAR